MRPSSARSDDSLRRGQEILDASAAVFSQRGYTGTSLDDIADHMGSTKGKMYHYYRSKAELLAAIMTRGTQDLLDAVRPIASDTSLAPPDRLESMARAHAITLMTSHSYQVVSMRARGENLYTGRGAETLVWDTIRRMRSDFENLYLEVVEEGRRTGAFHTDDVRTATRGVLGAVNWIAVWFRPEEADAASIERIASTTARFVRLGLCDA